MLKCCHNELSGVYQHLFQLSINSGIPRIWKTAVIVPVPKKIAAKEYNDYRPIALTSVPFKCLERILLKHLLPEIEDNLDPYQFSYSAAFQSPRANGAHDFEVGKIPVQPYVAFHSRTEPRWLIVLSCRFLLCLLLALINSVNRVFVLQRSCITHMLLYKPDTTTN